MTATARAGAFVVGLAALFAASFGVGAAVGQPGAGPAPVPTVAAPSPAGPGPVSPVKGLAVTDAGYTLQPENLALREGQQTFAFTIQGPDGQPVRHYAVTHEKELHLIVVRRDLTGFQHLHPVRDARGRWSTPLSLPAVGSYRVFADFAPVGRADSLTLGVDADADGEYRPQLLGPDRRRASVEDYEVTVDGDLLPGKESDLTLRVFRAGRPVADLQPYLGAFGHLVVLRDGDLGYLHVHPEWTPGDGSTEPGPDVAFRTSVPSAGAYRLFLDFQHNGRVHTAALTLTASPQATSVSQVPDQDTEIAPTHGDDHGH